jgi:DUF1680 family protein
MHEALSAAPVDTRHSPYACWRTLPLGSVVLGKGFWAKWQAINRRSSLEHGYQMLERSGNLHNFRVASGREQGSYQGRNFLDSDVYKWLEAVADELARTPDSPLRAKAGAVIDLVAAAQQPDGYLNTYFQIVEPEKRWTDLDHGHELYCFGHLFQAAVAYHRATGDVRLLDVARCAADYIDSIFGPDKRHGTCGHPEIEMALVELYRDTGERRYLDLAKFFIDQRGQGKMRGLGRYGPEYHQDRVPVRQAEKVEGHAVRAMYLLTGVTDLYLETGEQALMDSLLRQWRDMTGGKLHITGGVGARHEGESFGDPYELPNDQCYCETCAAIGSIMWNWRMLLATGEARFADVMEQTLYNGFLSGASLDGTHYFYINPLLSRGSHERAEWYGVACCPPNIMRTVGSIENNLATGDATGVQIHLYDTASITVEREAGRAIRVRMETEYPWQGESTITIDQTDSTPWRLALRIPGWCHRASIRLNGAPIGVPANASTYAVIDRIWQPGDMVELSLPMERQLIAAHPLIDPTRGSVAIMRGPLVYCLEQVDQDPEVDVMKVQIDETQPLEVHWDEGLLSGVMAINAAGYVIDTGPWAGTLYRSLAAAGDPPRQAVHLTAIPYHLWGNRGPDAMRVWIPRAVLP